MNDEQAQRVLHGSPIFSMGAGELSASHAAVSVRLKNEAGQLLAIGTHDTGRVGSIRIRKVLSLLSH